MKTIRIWKPKLEGPARTLGSRRGKQDEWKSGKETDFGRSHSSLDAQASTPRWGWGRSALQARTKLREAEESGTGSHADEGWGWGAGEA